MKKAILSLMSLMTFSAFAQLDTVSYDSYLSCPAGDTAIHAGFGYLLGTNSFGDLEKARLFSNSGNAYVLGIHAKFDGTNIADNGGSIYFKMYEVDENGAPGILVDSTDAVAISDINTDALTYFPFAPEGGISTQEQDYVISLVVPSSNSGNKTGLYMSTGRFTGDACGYMGTSHWERWSDGSWKDMSVTWNNFHPDSTAAAIFPVIAPPLTADEFNFDTQIELYPNPSYGSFFLEANTNESFNIMAYNALGKLVWSESNHGISTIEVSTEQWADGIYTIHITTQKGKRAIRKVVIQ